MQMRKLRKQKWRIPHTASEPGEQHPSLGRHPKPLHTLTQYAGQHDPVRLDLRAHCILPASKHAGGLTPCDDASYMHLREQQPPLPTPPPQRTGGSRRGGGRRGSGPAPEMMRGRGREPFPPVPDLPNLWGGRLEPGAFQLSQLR